MSKLLKISREELRKQLVSRDEEINITKDKLRDDIYFDFPNPYNLIFTVYYTTAKGYAVHKDFTNPTQAFHKWIKTPMRRNSAPFISVRPQNSNNNSAGFPYDYNESGYSFQIALRYIEYLERIEEWVKFLEEAHPNDLR